MINPSCNIYFHTVYNDFSSVSEFDTRREKDIVMYAKEEVKYAYSYGNISDYTIVDAYKKPSFVQFGDYRLYAFSTKGTAEHYLLELCVKTISNEDVVYTLSNDARFNLPYQTVMGFEEWSYPIFKSIKSFFDELNTYGYNVYRELTKLRVERHLVEESLRVLKYESQMKIDEQDGLLMMLKNSVIDVVISDNDTCIRPRCYYGSESIKRVIIHRNIRYILDDAFRDCHNLLEVMCMAITPPHLGNSFVFKGISENAKIYVPKVAVDNYKTAKEWEKYADIITAYDY